MLDHEDECDKILYDGGTCTCGLIREYGTEGLERTTTAAGEALELNQPESAMVGYLSESDAPGHGSTIG